jgi:hypothetical protein
MSATIAVSALPDRLRVNGDGNVVLLGVRCGDCGTSFFGAVDHCRRCTSDNLDLVELGSGGELYSYTVVYRAGADWTGPEPYALAEVVLPSGVAVTSRVANWQEGAELQIGSHFDLVTETIGEDEQGQEQVVYVWRRPE